MSKTKEPYCDLAMSMEKEFDYLEDNILKDLEDNNEEYRRMQHESSEMDYKYPFISKILYGREKMSVTEEELEVVREYLELESEIEDMDRRHIYLRGHTDAFAYLKKIGAL